MTKYYLITGLNEGRDIEPYITETNGSLPYVAYNQPYGDAVRYYEEISERKVIELMREGVAIY